MGRDAALAGAKVRAMDHDEAQRAVITVGEGRGFVVEGVRQRLVITAAHRLPHFPPSAAYSHLEERTYQDLLAPLGKSPKVWAECLFADPIGDIAVLGSPDSQALHEKSEAYEALMEAMMPLVIADAPKKGAGWMLSLDGQWFKCDLMHQDSRVWIIGAASKIEGAMSGSPIVNDNCFAIGVVCAGWGTDGERWPSGPNPRLVHNLPGWMLQELRGDTQGPITRPTDAQQ